jgi:hypothetical protein
MPSWQSYLIKPAIRLLNMRPGNKEQTFAARCSANDAISSRYTFPQDINYEPAAIDGLPAEWVTPSAISTKQVILYLHGGPRAAAAAAVSPTRSALAHPPGRVLND